MLRDRLLARLAEMGDAPDHQRLAAEVLGIRGAPPELARRLVAQALVLEDRREVWRQAGERICRDAPAAPGVYVLKDADGRALYVGKAVHLRRRLRAHFAERRWRALKPEMSRAADAEWQEVGSEIEALLREAALIHALQPPVNVQIGAPDLGRARGAARAAARRARRAAVDRARLGRADRRGGRRPLDDPAHAPQRRRSRRPRAPDRDVLPRRRPNAERTNAERRESLLSPLVFSWLAGRGADATRLDPHDSRRRSSCADALAALLADDRLFVERLDQR